MWVHWRYVRERLHPCTIFSFHITTDKPQQNRKEDTFKACSHAVHLQGAWGGSQSGGGVYACVGERVWVWVGGEVGVCYSTPLNCAVFVIDPRCASVFTLVWALTGQPWEMKTFTRRRSPTRAASKKASSISCTGYTQQQSDSFTNYKLNHWHCTTLQWTGRLYATPALRMQAAVRHYRR